MTEDDRHDILGEKEIICIAKCDTKIKRKE